MNKPVFKERISQEIYFFKFYLGRCDTRLFGLLKVKKKNCKDFRSQNFVYESNQISSKKCSKFLSAILLYISENLLFWVLSWEMWHSSIWFVESKKKNTGSSKVKISFMNRIIFHLRNGQNSCWLSKDKYSGTYVIQ